MRLPRLGARAAALACMLAATGAQAGGDVAAGFATAEAERCMECHGRTGQGDGPAESGGVHRFAKLAGQPRDYLALQLQRFRSGARKHEVMRLNAQRLVDADIDDLAAYFAAQPRVAAEAGGAAANSASSAAAADGAARLFAQGDAARGIAACAGCHGAAGSGAAPLVPLLAGQDARYLEQQLRDLRSGWRREPQGGSVKASTQRLDDREIRALAAWLAALP